VAAAAWRNVAAAAMAQYQRRHMVAGISENQRMAYHQQRRKAASVAPLGSVA